VLHMTCTAGRWQEKLTRREGGWWERSLRGGLAFAVALVAMIGVLAVLPSPSHAAATPSDTGTTTVSFNIAEAIEVTGWPSAAFSLSDAGVPGAPTVSDVMSISVRSNTTWGLQVSSDNDGGLMRE